MISTSRAILTAFVALTVSSSAFAKESDGMTAYRPSQFAERAETPFFYSVGKQLKYGFAIDAASPSLFEGAWLQGDLTAVYPSPDNSKAAVVSGRKLYIARAGSAPMVVLDNVDYYSPEKMRDGTIYYKWPTLQWHPDSRFIYIVKDKKQKSSIGYFSSKDATLVRIDIENGGSSQELVTDFKSLEYFFVGAHDVCFNYAPGDGSVVWKCTTDKGPTQARYLDKAGVHLDDGLVLTAQPFLSYKPNIYESEIWMARYGFSVRKLNERQDALFHKDEPSDPLVTINTWKNFKGNRMNGIRQMGGSVLPGGRYLLLNMVDGNGERQILLDRASRQYKELPTSTRVHRNLNSSHFENFIFTVDDSPGNDFRPSVRIFP